MFKKSLLLVAILALFACELPNSSSAKTRSVVNKYPYWDVTITKFVVDPNGGYSDSEKEQIKQMRITVDEKKLAVRSLALMKLVVNTQEFEEAFMKTPDLFSHRPGEVPGGEWNITGDDVWKKPLDKNRLLEVIRNAQISAKYIKLLRTDGVWRGLPGNELSYSYYGYKNPYHTGDRVEASQISFENPNSRHLFYFAELAFHEHMHNLGFDHIYGGVADVPYNLQAVFSQIARKITGEKDPDPAIQQKYAGDLKDLTNYYLSLYEKKGFFAKDTTYWDS